MVPSIGEAPDFARRLQQWPIASAARGASPWRSPPSRRSCWSRRPCGAGSKQRQYHIIAADRSLPPDPAKRSNRTRNLHPGLVPFPGHSSAEPFSPIAMPGPASVGMFGQRYQRNEISNQRAPRLGPTPRTSTNSVDAARPCEQARRGSGAATLEQREVVALVSPGEHPAEPGGNVGFRSRPGSEPVRWRRAPGAQPGAWGPARDGSRPSPPPPGRTRRAWPGCCRRGHPRSSG